MNNPTTRVDPSGMKSRVLHEGFDIGKFLEVAAKCSLAAFTVVEEAATVVTAGAAFASTLEGNVYGPAAGVSAWGVAIYNRDYTAQSVEWCFGGDMPTASSTIFLPANFPP